MSIEHGILSMPAGTAWASTGAYGWMFTANETFKVCGFRSSTPDNDTGTTCILWDASTMTAIVTAEILPGPAWTEVYFDAPITLEKGKQYVVSKYSTVVFYYSGAKNSTTFNPKISYVTGMRRNSSDLTVPRDQEADFMYPYVDILIGIPPDYSPRIFGNAVGASAASGGAAVEEMSVDTLDSIWNEVFTGGDVSE